MIRVLHNSARYLDVRISTKGIRLRIEVYRARHVDQLLELICVEREHSKRALQLEVMTHIPHRQANVNPG